MRASLVVVKNRFIRYLRASAGEESKKNVDYKYSQRRAKRNKRTTKRKVDRWVLMKHWLSIE